MIRYSSYGSINYRDKPREKIEWLDPLQRQYRELLELRERVKRAEAARTRNSRGTRRSPKT
jgi:hypothetical protein